MSSAVESDELEGDNPEFSAFASKYVQVEVEARAVAAVVVQARHSMLGSNDSLVESSEGSLAAPEGDEAGAATGDEPGSLQDSNSLYGSSSIQSLTYSDGFSVLDLSPFGDVNDDALRSVGATHPNLAMISRIDLSGCGDITGDGILSLVAPQQNITSLSLRLCSKITDDVLNSLLPRLMNLEFLDLTGCSQLTDESISRVALECPRLSTFLLDHTLSTVPKDIAVVSPAPANAIRRFYLSRTSNIPRKPSFDDNSSLDQSVVSETLCLIDLSQYSDVTDAGLYSVAMHHPQLSAVTHINLSGCSEITDAGFVSVFVPQQDLVALNMRECSQITDAALLNLLPILAHLEFLDLTGCAKLTDASVSKILVRCMNLREFSWEGTQTTLPAEEIYPTIGDLRRHYVFGVLSPTKLPRMKSLAETGGSPSNAMPNQLDLSIYRDVHDETVFELARHHPNLLQVTHLNLEGCNALTEAGFTAVVHPGATLVDANFNGCLNLTDGFLRSIARNLINAEHIDVTGCAQLTDMSIGAIALECPRLDTFLIDGTQATVPTASLATHASAIRRYYLSQLMTFDFSDESSAGSLSVVSETLTHFDLTNYPNVDDMTLSHITDHHTDLSYITHINLGGCSLITDAGFDMLFARYQNVVSLTLRGCSGISDAVLLDRLPQLQTLEFLDLTDCPLMTDESIGALALSCEGLNALHISGTRATVPSDRQHASITQIRRYYVNQETPAASAKRELLLQAADQSMQSSSVHSLRSSANSSLLDKVRTSQSSVQSRRTTSADEIARSGSMGAASFGAGSVAAEKHIARSGSISIGAGSYGAGSAAAAGSASATSLVRHASVPASPGASSGALPSGPSAASAVDNTDGPMVRTDRSGSIASAVSMDADLLPRTVEEAEPATSIAARQREIESESALPFRPAAAQINSHALYRRDSGRNSDEIQVLREQFAAERAALEQRLKSMQPRAAAAAPAQVDVAQANHVDRLQRSERSATPPPQVAMATTAPVVVSGTGAQKQNQAPLDLLMQQQQKVMEQAFNQRRVETQMQEMDQQSEFLRERVQEARQMITDSRDLTQQLGIELTLSLRKQKEAAETAVGVLEVELQAQKDENAAMRRRLALLEERVTVAETAETETKRVNVSLQGRLRQVEESRSRELEELERLQQENETQQKLHADQHSELTEVLRAKEDMEERYAKQHHNTRERHADEMRRQAAIHSVKMERLRTDHAAEMAKVLEEFNASKEFKTYSEDPPSWFTELFSAQLLRLQQTAGYREFVPGVTSVSREGLQELLNGILFPCVLGKSFEQVRERVSACPSDFQAKEVWKLVHEGGAVAARPGVLKYPTMRPPSNNAMAFASESDDRMRSAPSPVEQPLDWQAPAGAPAGPEYIAAPAPSGKRAMFSDRPPTASGKRPGSSSAGVYPTPHGFRAPQAGDHTFAIPPKADRDFYERAKNPRKERPRTAHAGQRKGLRKSSKSSPGAPAEGATASGRPTTADTTLSFRRGKKIHMAE